MTLRTPRRRISPRTKLRYRAIREFFRRALGSTSQQNIKINSSIAVNVTDLKRKIVGLEQQLGEVSKHCRDIVSLDQSRRESDTVSQSESKQDSGIISTVNQEIEPPFERNSNGIETQIVFKSKYKVSDDSDYTPKLQNDNDIKETETVINKSDGHVTKITNKKNKLHKISNNSSKLHKHKTRSVYDNAAMVYSTSSFHSLTNARIHHSHTIHPKHTNENRIPCKEENKDEMIPYHHRSHKYNVNVKNYTGDHLKSYYEDRPIKTRKIKRTVRELDSDFIADIIRRQYKPVKLFNNTKESELSQFSAPVCRDQEVSMQSSKADSELCSCLHGGISFHKHLRPRHQDLNVMQSVCDTRNHSPKKHIRQKHRKMHVDAHSNSDMYDLVPVKERSSPKTRRKFVEDSGASYEYYREVPPSPRTLRPKLNLKAQYYTEIEDYKQHLKKQSPKLQKRYRDCSEQFDSDITSELISVASEKRLSQSYHTKKQLKVPLEEKQVQEQTEQNTITPISYQYPQYVNEQTSITMETSLNKTLETEITVDKTDKALTEIKDILQSFLHEIKKETVNSQCDKSEITCKTQDDSNVLQDTNPIITPNLLPNSASFNNYNVGQCGITPYITPFTNPCCYPMMPMCSLNCSVPVQNGYAMPSQSYTCTNCAKVPKETNSAHCCAKTTDLPSHTETDELIKEIYKFVAQGPSINHASVSIDKQNDLKKTDSKILTSRSIGESNNFFKQDANVGTQPLKCYSKSCEAIGSRMVSETIYTESNESYSDSLLDKLSVEVTTPHTYSETEIETFPTDTIPTDPNKVKNNRFSRLLRSIGLFKKKKADTIEEISENDSETVDQITENESPLRQNLINYMMYGQEYFRPPPLEPLLPKPHDYLQSHEYRQYPHEYRAQWLDYQRGPFEYHPDYNPPYNPGMHGEPTAQVHNPYAHRYQPQMHKQHSEYAHGSKQRPTAPQFTSSYETTSHSQIQPGLCLKEIEVKSTGTQSDKKVSILKKIKKKMKPPTKTLSTEETQRNPRVAFNINEAQKEKKLFNWKGLSNNTMQGIDNDVNFTLQTQQKLVAGDQNIRNALMKKFFRKKNPFSPRNALIKTFFGKNENTLKDFPVFKELKPPKLFM